MDLRTQLLVVHSKANTRLVADWVGQDPKKVAQLMQLFMQEEYRAVQRASWVVSEIGCAYPQLLQPYHADLLRVMATPPHPGVLRNSLKYFADTNVDLPEDEEGELVGMCFELLADLQQAPAIQVHAMRCIAHRLDRYPDLAIELKELVEIGMEYGSTGYRSRGGKVLKQIAKMGLSQ